MQKYAWNQDADGEENTDDANRDGACDDLSEDVDDNEHDDGDDKDNDDDVGDDDDDDDDAGDDYDDDGDEDDDGDDKEEDDTDDEKHGPHQDENL